MFLIPYLFTPVGRAIAIFIVVSLAFGAVYIKTRNAIWQSVQNEIAHDSMERLGNAVRAGDAARSNPERVLELDKKYCRDC